MITANTLKDLYLIYQKDVMKDLCLSYREYSDLLNMFNKELINSIIYESADIKLPHLGNIRIRKTKVNLTKLNKLLPNWEATNKLWAENPEAKEKKQLVFHLNEHRGGYKYKIYWDKTKVRLKNKSFYYFIPAREFKRDLAKVLKNNFEIDYYL